MRKLTFSLATTFVASMMMASSASAAAKVMVLGAGSSAMWQSAAIGAYYNLAGSGAGHWTVKGQTAAKNNYAQIHDVRSSAIPVEGGNLWVVWNSAQTEVWAYISVDSVVGNRSYFAAPRAQLQLDASVVSTPGQNLISSALLGGTADNATGLPSAIYTALQNAPITTAFTDIRPEDAKAAQTRANSALTSTLTGLGYTTGTPTIGLAVESAFTSSAAHPIEFNLSGTDPITSSSIPAHTTIPVGAEPIVFIINRTNANGLGKSGVFKNISAANVVNIFNGENCNSSAFGISGSPAVPLTVILREPISGTMNTTEYTNFRLGGPSDYTSTNSQEANIGEPVLGTSTDPLNKTCVAGSGKRERAIGTGEVVANGVLPNADSIGYVFFSYGNVSKIAGSSSYGYVQLDGYDPIFASYSNGNLPTCTAPCPVGAGTVNTFPNLRDGKYRSWSLLRVVTDAVGTTNYTNTNALVSAAQKYVDSTVPDFVPYSAESGTVTGGSYTDPGLKYYRSHYTQAGVAPNNGIGNPAAEAGGDVGGCIEPTTTNVLNCHEGLTSGT